MISGISKQQLLSGSLQALSLLLRVGLTIIVARVLPLDAAGLFFIYLATMQLSSGVLNLDIYASTVRKVLRTDAKNDVLAHHFGGMLFSLFTLGPLCVLLFWATNSEFSGLIIAVFFVHLMSETIVNDIARLLTTVGRPLAAATITFLRSAIWVIPITILAEFGDVLFTTKSFVIAWAVGSFFATALGWFILTRNPIGAIRPIFDRSWVFAAIKSSALFFVGTIAFRVVVGVDKYLVRSALDLESVAIYGVYVSVAFGAISLLETGISAWHYPKMILGIQENDQIQSIEKLKTFLTQCAIAAVGITIGVAVFFPVLAWTFLAPDYAAHFPAFYVICAGTLCFGLSVPFHYFIYGHSKDAFLLVVYALGFVSLILFWFIVLPELGILGAAIMFTAALATIALSRAGFSYLLIQNRVTRTHSEK